MIKSLKILSATALLTSPVYAATTLYDATNGTPDPTDSSHNGGWTASGVVTGNGSLGGGASGNDNAGAITHTDGSTLWQINDQLAYPDAIGARPNYYTAISAEDITQAHNNGFTATWAVQVVTSDGDRAGHISFGVDLNGASEGRFGLNNDNEYRFGGELNSTGILLYDGTQLDLSTSHDWTDVHMFNLQWTPSGENSGSMTAWWNSDSAVPTTGNATSNGFSGADDGGGRVRFGSPGAQSGDSVANYQEITFTTNVPEPSSSLLLISTFIPCVLRRQRKSIS